MSRDPKDIGGDPADDGGSQPSALEGRGLSDADEARRLAAEALAALEGDERPAGDAGGEPASHIAPATAEVGERLTPEPDPAAAEATPDARSHSAWPETAPVDHGPEHEPAHISPVAATPIGAPAADASSVDLVASDASPHIPASDQMDQPEMDAERADGRREGQEAHALGQAPGAPPADPHDALTEAERASAAEAARLAAEEAERAAFVEENTLGSLLFGARASLGKHDLKVIAQEIRIQAKYLDAIERLEVENLPGEAYWPGYVKTYAAHLQEALPLTPEEALVKFRRELAVKEGRDPDAAAAAGPNGAEAVEARAAAALSERVAPRISRPASADPAGRN
ncbi:MAG: helix-turn-helix domain-containing protein, partial [Pseudomonadota bacterium]